MKPPAPAVVRKGGLVRVAGGSGDVGAEVYALAYLDLCFEDGHVERWVDGGSIFELPTGPNAMATLQKWGRAAAEEYAFSVMCEVARRYAGVEPRSVDPLPCADVVIEWHCHPTGS